MRVQIYDPRHLASLVDFLRRAELDPVTLPPDVVEVELVPPRSERELELYLLAWRAMNPDAAVAAVY